MSPEREAALHALEQRLGHRFSDLACLDRALTHTSHANEDASGRVRHNESLEFLGDSVLGFLVADLLHRRDPDGPEGRKTKARAQVVSAASLAGRAAALGLPDLILLGRGEEKSGGRKKRTIWADAYEALVAALYLDGGIDVVRAFLQREFAQELAGERTSIDYKSALQEALQARGEPLPEYVVVAEEGPSHRRRFRLHCRIHGQVVSEGEGFSKKEAQQEAAMRALEGLAQVGGASGAPQ